MYNSRIDWSAHSVNNYVIYAQINSNNLTLFIAINVLIDSKAESGVWWNGGSMAEWNSRGRKVNYKPIIKWKLCKSKSE